MHNTEQLEMEKVSKKERIISIIESLLFVSGDPLTIKQISSIVECSIKETEEIIEEIKDKYNSSTRGIQVIKIKDSYQLVTKRENSTYIEKLLNTNSRQSLSQAALESLAIIAYKQPITRIEVEEIRGVKSDKAILNLVEKNLIKESGRKDVPGRPILYTTSEEFLKYFGIESLKELPDFEEFKIE